MMDFGSATFSSAPAARSAVNALNPLTPGGMSPKNTHLPTLAWAVIGAIVIIILYRSFGKR
jgi:uncharacterized membrane protein YeaQ/YmgE (transglycosylase-associated protein family)